MSNNKQSSVDFYRIESQKLMIKAIRKEITEKEWRLLENKLGEQAKAMYKEERKNAQMDMFHFLNNLPYGVKYLEKRQSAEDFAEKYKKFGGEDEQE